MPAKQCEVRFIFDFFQCILAGQQFIQFCELFILCSCSFQFFFFEDLLVHLQFRKFSEIFSFAAPELILHEYSVEGYTLIGILVKPRIPET